MILTEELPYKEGVQFICIYEYNKLLWSTEYRIDDMGYSYYNSPEDEFEYFSEYTFIPWEDDKIDNIMYVVMNNDDVGFIHIEGVEYG